MQAVTTSETPQCVLFFQRSNIDTIRPQGIRDASFIILLLAFQTLTGCGQKESKDTVVVTERAKSAVEDVTSNESPELLIDASSFSCLREMTAVRHFFVDNLLGDLEATVAVANSTDGGVYPPGSVVQLVPTEVMVKHRPGCDSIPITRETIAGIQSEDPRCPL